MPRCLSKKIARLLDVLEYVEHQNQIKGGLGLEGADLTQMNAAPPPSALSDGHGIGFDALDVTELLEFIEEQPCATSDVQDPQVHSALRKNFFNLADEDPLPSAPPPVLVVQAS